MGSSQVWILLLLVALLNAGFAMTHSGCGSCQSPARKPAHDHHHSCDHGHDHHHHHHEEEEALIRRKLPEELAEEEDLKLYGFGSHHDHDYGHEHFDAKELSGLGLWLNALGCSFLVSMASLICLIILPVIFVQGKPSRAVVDSLALFGAGAMLGDAFLHQLPHAFGGEHSHTHDHHDNHAHPGHEHSHTHDHHDNHAHPGHEHSHAHSLKDLSVGISVLAGIVLFLLVEKLVRYVEDNSKGAGAWGHSHHHHHKNSRKEKDDGDSHDDAQPPPTSNKKNKKRKSAKDDKPDTDAATNNTKSLLQEEPAQPPSNLVFGYLNLFSDGVHNFTDGMALGSAFLLYGSVGGWSRTLFLLAHELPQEVGDFGILVRSGFSVSKALFFNFLSALVALAGTAMALLMGKDPGQSSLIEGFTAGGFIYIAVAGVLAEMNNSSSVTLKSTVVHLTSLILGMAIALGISLVE